MKFAGIACLIAQLWCAASYNMELKSVMEFQNSMDDYGVSDVWGYTDETGIEYAIVGYLNGTAIFDVSTNPDYPITVATIPGPSSGDYYYHRDYKTYGDVLYTVCEMHSGDMGMQVIDMSPLPENPPVQQATYSEMGQSHNLWVDADGYAYIEHGWEDAIHIADLTNPLTPVYAGSFGDMASNCHDIFTRNDIAYVSEGWDYQFGIYDVSDFANIQPLAMIPVVSGGYAHNAWPTEDGNYLVTTEETEDRTVKVWDIRDFDDITLTGEYLAENGLAHNVHVMGDLVYISHYTTGIRIVDIFDPTYPVEVAGYDTYPQNDGGGYYGCWGAYPFTQNGFVFASDMQNGLYVLDFEPVYAGWFEGNIYDADSEFLTGNAEISSQLDGRTFDVGNGGQVHIGMPEGNHTFDVMLGEVSIGQFDIEFLPHETIIGEIYLYSSYLAGDISGDGLINVTDIVLTVGIILGNHDPTPEEYLAADMNLDLQINVQDIIMIINIILNIDG